MEVVITIDELRRAGINVTVVPVRKRLQVDACQGIDIVADAPISDCAGADFDLILPPGGMPGAATLGDGDILESMVKKHADEGQPYARFRVAPAVALGSWGLMHGFAFWFDVELNGSVGFSFFFIYFLLVADSITLPMSSFFNTHSSIFMQKLFAQVVKKLNKICKMGLWALHWGRALKDHHNSYFFYYFFTFWISK
ncbi:hypothetical protein VitviT2T_010240 [Vitis vinifera]|uniref:DJ-1/PfpI domain-containing protein n=1 Tax=Vitis vinifera TaxID=29760 RepID=A0ABY9C7X2_VITVI|nr:hypothetical protein VitviT2T_010240 [Vitis vinifera]